MDRMEKRSSAGRRLGFPNADGILAGEAASADVGEQKDSLRERPEMSFEDQTCPSQQHLTRQRISQNLLLKAYFFLLLNRKQTV